MKKAIVTGATGFVGANLARRLLRDGHEVYLLVRPDFQGWRIEEIRQHVQLHIVDFQNRSDLDQTFASIKPDWIFHLAAHGAYSWQTDAARILQTNITGTVNLVEAALKTGFETFVNTGSSSEYGLKDHAPAEDEITEPNSYYALGKASATMFCRMSAVQHQVAIPTLRLYSIYGDYEEKKRLIPALILNGLEGKWPPLVNPDIARDYVYIDDAVEAFLLAATTKTSDPGAVYNVGSQIQTTLAQIVRVAREKLAVEAEPVWNSMPNRNWDTDVWVSNSRKIERELGWKPRFDLATGFEKSVEWFGENLHFYR